MVGFLHFHCCQASISEDILYGSIKVMSLLHGAPPPPAVFWHHNSPSGCGPDLSASLGPLAVNLDLVKMGRGSMLGVL